MLSREAVAAAMALAGVRSGAHVLDLTPAAGLTRAARAAAGGAGRVDEAGTDLPQSAPPVRYGYAIGIWSDAPAEQVLQSVEEALPALAPYARITIGSSGSLVALVDRLRLAGWTVLHGTSVAYDGPRSDGGSSRSKSTPLDRSRDLALVAARAPQ